MFYDIPRNIWRHSPEYNISPIPCVLRIPFPVPVFLFLYIAIRNIIRAMIQTRYKQIKAIMMLKKVWGKVTEQTVQNCFRKLEILLEAQEGAMDVHDDPLKGMVDDSEDNIVVEELEFDLNQLGEARPDLAPENLDADGLFDFNREVAINES